jgi:hypothetical protein
MIIMSGLKPFSGLHFINPGINAGVNGEVLSNCALALNFIYE